MEVPWSGLAVVVLGVDLGRHGRTEAMMRWSRPRLLLLSYALGALAAGVVLGLATLWADVPGQFIAMGLVGAAVALVSVGVLGLVGLILLHGRRR
jgi:hypothetical protein